MCDTDWKALALELGQKNDSLRSEIDKAKCEIAALISQLDISACRERDIASQLSEANHEASVLAMSLWKNHYKDESPNFGLCDTVVGIITQIDNMVAGINEQLSEARARCRELESALESFAVGGAVDCIMREDYSVMQERIKDWFGVSDFKRANEVYAARLRQQTSETPDERSCMYSEYDEAE